MAQGPWHTDRVVALLGDGIDGEVHAVVGPVACLATVPSATVALGPGEWRLTTRLWSEPVGTAPPEVTTTQTVGLAEEGTVQTEPLRLRVYRSFTGATVVRCEVAVERRRADSWSEHTAPAAAEIVLSEVEPSGHTPRWGANLHVYIPGDRPPGSLDVHLDRMASVGMELVRTSIPWGLLCPLSDDFDQEALAQADAFFDGCRGRDLSAVPIIDAHCPTWCEGARPRVPSTWDAYTDFVRRCLERWGDTFAAVVTQNEPNHPGHVDDFTPDLVVAAAGAARAAIDTSPHAGVPLLGPGIAYGDGDYLDELLDAGLGEVVDGVACHPYAIRFDLGPPQFQAPERPWGDAAGDPNHLVSGVEVMWERLQRRGLSLPIWVNEYGLSTSRTGPDGTLSGLDVTEEVQAEWLATAVQQASAIPYVEAFCIYMLHDNPWKTVAARYDDADPDDTSWQACFGIVGWDGRTEKAAFDAVRLAIAQTAGTT